MFPAPKTLRRCLHRHVLVSTALTVMALLSGCSRSRDPRAAFESAQQTFTHGNFTDSQKEGSNGFVEFRKSHPDWAWKFKILEAESLLWSGMYEPSLDILKTVPPERLPEVELPVLTIQAAAHARLPRDVMR